MPAYVTQEELDPAYMPRVPVVLFPNVGAVSTAPTTGQLWPRGDW